LTTVPGWRTLSSVLWLSVVVDNACTRVWEAWGIGAKPTSMRVNPAVYGAVAAARPGEVARDCPLMLLGLPLIADPARVSVASRACPGECIRFEIAATVAAEE
jgi:hypothetical protein